MIAKLVNLACLAIKDLIIGLKNLVIHGPKQAISSLQTIYKRSQNLQQTNLDLMNYYLNNQMYRQAILRIRLMLFVAKDPNFRQLLVRNLSLSYIFLGKEEKLEKSLNRSFSKDLGNLSAIEYISNLKNEIDEISTSTQD